MLIHLLPFKQMENLFSGPGGGRCTQAKRPGPCPLLSQRMQHKKVRQFSLYVFFLQKATEIFIPPLVHSLVWLDTSVWHISYIWLTPRPSPSSLTFFSLSTTYNIRKMTRTFNTRLIFFHSASVSHIKYLSTVLTFYYWILEHEMAKLICFPRHLNLQQCIPFSC